MKITTPLPRISGKKYLINFNIDWSEILIEAKNKWPSISTDDPTEKDLKDLGFKIALKWVTKGWDLMATKLRQFQDSNIECDLKQIAENTDKEPISAEYGIKVIIYPEKPMEDIKDIGIDEYNEQQQAFNEAFIKHREEFEVYLNSLNLTWE